MDHVSWLSDVYGPRLTGSPGIQQASEWTKFYDETTPNGFNTIADIPGTDLASEIVLLGAHFDSHPYATGATDNATGSGAMMEAVRILKAVGAKPRRTIRIALWGGEEQACSAHAPTSASISPTSTR